MIVKCEWNKEEIVNKIWFSKQLRAKDGKTKKNDFRQRRTQKIVFRVSMPSDDDGKKEKEKNNKLMKLFKCMAGELKCFHQRHND